MHSVVLFCLHLITAKSFVSCVTKIRTFPDGFMFGASSAAYQVEGGWNEDGKGLSIWDVKTHRDPSPVDDGSTGDVAADSYHQYRRDVELAKELGLDFYRFSVSWTRLFPNGFTDKINQAGVNYYNNLINELVINNIKPVLTMYHWDMPWSLQILGGWINPLAVEWFTDYAKVLFEKFGDRVKHWVTINEPKQICYDGYGADLHTPVANITGIGPYLCAKNVLLAHAKAYHLYDEEYRSLQNGTIGISICLNWFEPASETIDDYQAAVDAKQFEWGQFANPIFSKDGDFPNELKQNVATKSAEQGFPRSRLPELSALEVAFIRGSSDFLGVSSYTTKLAYRDASLEGLYPVPSVKDDMGAVLVKDPSWPQSSKPWLQIPTTVDIFTSLKLDLRRLYYVEQVEVPWGFTKVLVEVKNLYDNPPVYVLENGWATTGGLLDDSRITYHRNYLNALLDAEEEGCDIRAYAIWSLIDNFEWTNGYTQKCGLYEVDFSSPEKTRTPRKSAFVYKEVIRSKVLDPYYEPENFFVETSDQKD